MSRCFGMARGLRSAWLVGLLLGCIAPAQANFHLFITEEIFSDASGNIQYAVLSTASDFQQQLTGHQIATSQGTSTHSYNFTTDLPTFMTSGHKILIATQGFADIPGVVTPDYIVPNGFFFIPGGAINWGPGFDMLTYSALPTDGTHAKDRAGNIVTAAPVNFAGTTGTINAPPPTPAGPFDIDANGQLDPLTDGLLLQRYLFGLRGDALTKNAIGTSAARNTAEAIQAYLVSQGLPP